MARTTFKNDMRITGALTVAGTSTLSGAISAPSITATGAVTGATIVGAITNTVGTATATAGAATLNSRQGKITSEALTTAQDASYTLTLTNSTIAAADNVFVSIANGTNSAGMPVVSRVTPEAGSVVIVITNTIAAALNGTLVVSFQVLKSA